MSMKAHVADLETTHNSSVAVATQQTPQTAGPGKKNKNKNKKKDSSKASSQSSDRPSVPNPNDYSFLGCYRCNGLDHYPVSCPHKKHICSNCKQEGHLEKKCRKKPSGSRSNTVQQGDNSSQLQENSDPYSGNVPAVQV